MERVMRGSLILLFCIYVPMTVFAYSDSGMTYSQGDEIIGKLQRTLTTLKSWSEDNTRKANRLEKYFEKDNGREENNTTYHNKEAWRDVKSLNQSSMLLLEASYAFAKSTESAATLSEDSIRSKAWEDCLGSPSCSFKKLNEMLDKEALSISAHTRENALLTQKSLLDSIDKLNEFSMQSEDATGLNDSLDTLSKVNATQANALVQLTAQISNLNKISAHAVQKDIEKQELNEKADEIFLKNNSETKSRHLKVSM